MNSGIRHIDVGPELTRPEWESQETHALVHGSSFPATPVERQLFYRDDLHEWYIYDGTAWQTLQAAATLTVHDNAYHTPNFEEEGVAATQIETHRTGAVHVLDQPPAAHDNAKHTTNYATEAALTTHEGNADAHKGQKNSVALDGGDLQLDGDAASPGNNKVYGTGATGTKGWKDDPTGMSIHDNAYHTPNFAEEAAFNTHAARHESGGADQVSVAGLSGELADDQPPKSHDNAKHDPAFSDTTTADVNLYVDAATGNDANPGTSASPKATIWGALNVLPSVIAHAAIIHVRPGTYAEGDTRIDFARFNTLAYIYFRAVNASDETMYGTGKATGGGNNYLDDSGASWSTNRFAGAYIWIYEGTGAGQIREIASNTGTRITTTTNWSTNPDNTSYYVIGGGVTISIANPIQFLVDGKKVSVSGFRHINCTSRVFDYRNHAAGSVHYNYVDGCNALNRITGLAEPYMYYNYADVTTYGLEVNTASCWARMNVIHGASGNGFWITRNGIVHSIGSSGAKNFFSNCGTGIKIGDGSGCVSATTQGFSGCTTNIDPASSTVIPAWYH